MWRSRIKLYFEILKLCLRKYLLRQRTGKVLKQFAEHLGVTYIKFAQILAMQNIGNLFTEEDRTILAGLCDHCQEISFSDITKILTAEYGANFMDPFSSIDEHPIGSASISQVHRARLATGEDVVLKIKRQDLAANVERDLCTIRHLMHRYGKLFRFRNYIGGDHALDMYLAWIHDEIDFRHEIHNLRKYHRFINTVNGKLGPDKSIHAPKLYKDLCTDNIIVMEYIPNPTINHLTLSPENQRKIRAGLNNYIELSFWALLHDEDVIFHGDPHSGNIYLGPDGSIGFLDMGLIFELSKTDRELTRQFFLAVYAGNTEKLYELLQPYAKLDQNDQDRLKADLAKYCNQLKSKNVTTYFTDMIAICLKYEFCPPDFLFCMAKAFLCLNGINTFSHNSTTGYALLRAHVSEFLITRTIKDFSKLTRKSTAFLPQIIKDLSFAHPQQSIFQYFEQSNSLRHDISSTLNNAEEALRLLHLQLKQL